MSYICDKFFIFSLIYTAINHITLFKQAYLFFLFIYVFNVLLFLDDEMDEESK